MKTVLEIIKGLATKGNGGRSRKGTVAFVTMMDDTNFIVNYLIAQLKAEKIKFISETENEETFAVSGGSTLTIKKDGQSEFLGYILDKYTVTYRTARGGVYIVHASSKNTEATTKFIASQDVINQAPIIETPAVEVNETQDAAEAFIAEFENDAQGFLNRLPKLIDAGTLSNGFFEPITFSASRTTYDLNGYGEGAKLIIKTAAADGEKFASIELVLGGDAAAKKINSETMALVKKDKPTDAEQTSGGEYNDLPITAKPPVNYEPCGTLITTKRPYVLKAISYNHIWGSCTSAREVGMDAYYYGRTQEGKHRFVVPSADIQARWPEYTDAQLKDVLVSVAVL